MYRRVHDCWNRPVCSCAGAEIDVLGRDRHCERETNGEITHCVNLGSYNYLGFAEPHGPTEKPVLRALRKFGISTTSPLGIVGRTKPHDDLESLVAAFLNVDDAMVIGMGWATNATAIPSLVGKGCLIFSDALNHNSIVAGCRASGAKIRVFNHNDTADLEEKIKHAIAEGQARTHIPFRKILIIVEGIYSMEGSMSSLKEIVRLKKKYKCYLYVDEAHSIGALGSHGRGICEHAGVDTKDVDILMGTFTKSFGAIGGYVAGDKKLVSYLRHKCASQYYSAGLSPACVAQIASSMRIIMGKEQPGLGQKKISNLHDNSNWFRKKLQDKGLLVLGAKDSAIIPVVVGHPGKTSYISRECLKVGLALVIVGFPATPLLSARVRFCISASHTREMLQDVLEKFMVIVEKANACYLKAKKKPVMRSFKQTLVPA